MFGLQSSNFRACRRTSCFIGTLRRSSYRRPANLASILEVRRTMNTSYLQVLGTGQTDSFPSVGLVTPHVRLVFNCGENQQRVLAEHTHGLTLCRVNCFFITRGHWNNVAGLPGASLSFHSDEMAKTLLYCGPQPTSKIMSSLVPFSVHPSASPELLVPEFTSKTSADPLTFDGGIKVVPLVISARTRERCPTLASGGATSDSEAEPRRSPPPAKKRCVGAFAPSSSPSLSDGSEASQEPEADLCAAYVCQMPNMPGTFSVTKALELGIPKGPLYRDLNDGKAVMSPESGKLVKPEDVTGPPNKGPHFLVLECPTEDFLEPTTQSEKFADWQSGGQYADVLVLVVHMTLQELFNSAPYQAWLKSFPPNVQHLVLNKEVASAPLVQVDGSRLQTQLNVLDRHIFPIPYYDYRVTPAARQLPQNCQNGVLMLNFILYKHAGRRSSVVHGWSNIMVQQPIDPSDIARTLMASADISTAVKELWRALEESNDEATPRAASPSPSVAKDATLDEKSNDSSDDLYPWTAKSSPPPSVPPTFDPLDTQVVFLGTGSAVPGKLRNVSGILLKFGELSMLMDAGEGTLGQMYRVFGTKLDNLLYGLRLIHISHIHADHQGGIPCILLEREAACKRLKKEVPPLTIIAPTTWQTQIKRLGEAMPLPKFTIHRGADVEIKPLSQAHLSDTGLPLDQIRLIPVNHGVPCWAIELRIRGAAQEDGSLGKDFTLVYSGDTMYCSSLASQAHGADVLIHEATLENSLAELAAKKKHSTVGDALAIASEMKAGFLILTHFSQRYKMPVLSGVDDSPVPYGVAFDMMVVRLRELDRLPKLVPTLKFLFDRNFGKIPK